MNKYLKTSLTIFILGFQSAAASASVYVGSSHWWNQEGFSETSTLGAQFQSVQGALANCRLSGASYCEYLVTSVEGIYTENGNRHLKFKSTSRSLSSEELSNLNKVKTIKGSGSVSSSNTLGSIASEAAKYFSFTNAIMSCHLDSCKKCIPQETTMIETNNYREGAYYSTSQTLVDCYKVAESSNGVVE